MQPLLPAARAFLLNIYIYIPSARIFCSRSDAAAAANFSSDGPEETIRGRAAPPPTTIAGQHFATTAAAAAAAAVSCGMKRERGEKVLKF